MVMENLLAPCQNSHFWYSAAGCLVVPKLPCCRGLPTATQSWRTCRCSAATTIFSTQRLDASATTLQGVANRDLKLENLLLDRPTTGIDGDWPLLKICDFGEH